MTLRGALSMKTADAFRSVYCWQTVRCLELWARVLTELGPQSVRSPPRPLPTALSGPAVSNSNSNNSPLEPWSLCVSPEVHSEVHSEVCRSTDLDGVLHPSTGIGYPYALAILPAGTSPQVPSSFCWQLLCWHTSVHGLTLLLVGFRMIIA